MGDARRSWLVSGQSSSTDELHHHLFRQRRLVTRTRAPGQQGREPARAAPRRVLCPRRSCPSPASARADRTGVVSDHRHQRDHHLDDGVPRPGRPRASNPWRTRRRRAARSHLPGAQREYRTVRHHHRRHRSRACPARTHWSSAPPPAIRLDRHGGGPPCMTRTKVGCIATEIANVVIAPDGPATPGGSLPANRAGARSRRRSAGPRPGETELRLIRRAHPPRPPGCTGCRRAASVPRLERQPPSSPSTTPSNRRIRSSCAICRTVSRQARAGSNRPSSRSSHPSAISAPSDRRLSTSRSIARAASR